MHKTRATALPMRFVAPILAAAALTLFGLTLFLIWSAQLVDLDALEREKRLMQRSLDEQVHQMELNLEEFGVWDEAVNAYRQNDIEWLTDNLAAGLYEYYQHNRIMVFDGALQPIVAMLNGGRLPPSLVGTDYQELQPLFSQLRSLDSVAMISAYNKGTQVVAPTLSAFMTLAGRPSLIGMIPLLPYLEANALPAQEEPVLVVAMHLDATLAAYLGDQYLIKDVRFTETGPEKPKPASLAIKNQYGDVITWIEWTPDQPGTMLLSRAVPGLLAGLLVVGLTMGFLLRNLHAALSQLQREREEAEYRALHDPLTQLGNRNLFQRRLAEGLHTLNDQRSRLALLTLDLDRFKQVNDTLGHDAGDELLRQVARRLENLASPKDTLCRLGGDEFAVIQSDLGTIEQATDLAARIVASLSEPFLLVGHTANIGVSVGVALAPDMARDAEDLNRLADNALYAAKTGGRNRFCLAVSTPSSSSNLASLHTARSRAGSGGA